MLQIRKEKVSAKSFSLKNRKLYRETFLINDMFCRGNLVEIQKNTKLLDKGINLCYIDYNM